MAKILEQLGPQYRERLLMALICKLSGRDAEVFITEADLEQLVMVTIDDRRHNLAVIGEKNGIRVRLATDAELQAINAIGGHQPVGD
jgi:hypothetical protein